MAVLPPIPDSRPFASAPRASSHPAGPLASGRASLRPGLPAPGASTCPGPSCVRGLPVSGGLCLRRASLSPAELFASGGRPCLRRSSLPPAGVPVSGGALCLRGRCLRRASCLGQDLSHPARGDPSPDIRPAAGYVLVMAPARVRGCARSVHLLSAGGPARQADASRRQNGPRKATYRRPITVRLRSKSCLAGGSDILRAGRRALVATSCRKPLSRRMWGRRPGRPGGCPDLARAEGGFQQ
jgi:hypothetical protein